MKDFICLFLCLLPLLSYAQDERFYRKMFSGELSGLNEKAQSYKVTVASKDYLFDLNRDGIKERIRTLKRDGVDYIKIEDFFGSEKLSKKLVPLGIDSAIYKLELKTISSQTDVLIMHYYEGATELTKFEATARVYFIAIQNRNLETLYFKKGPIVFHEKEQRKKQYLNRSYQVSVFDYNGDGRNEISVNYNNIQHIYFYIRNGIWRVL